MAAARPKKFRAVVASADKRVFVPVPFDPDATKRSPELRASRIAEVVRLCEDGVKERPRS